MITHGTIAPDIKGTAVSFKRPFRLQDWRGQPVIFLFVDYRTAPQTQEVARTLRQKFPHHSVVLLVIIVNLQIVPGPMRGVARSMLAQIIRNTARQLPAGIDPADQLIVLPDWEGKVCGAYGVGDLGRAMGVVMVNGNGRIQATYQGDQPAQAVLQMATDYLSAAHG